MTPSVFIKTYGCQMNERDTEQVASMFLDYGYQLAKSEREADIVLMNTCSVREKAELKALGKMGIISSHPHAKPHTVYGFMGCMSQSKGQEIFRDIPRADIVAGTQQYQNVFTLAHELLQSRLASGKKEPIQKGAHICAIEEVKDDQNAIRDHIKKAKRSAAFVSIMQGCDMRCSYCIVPSTRGIERSRPPEDILAEAEKLVSEGVKEITLLGQIVNRYGRSFPVVDGKGAFVQLLEALHAIEGLERIRFTSPHPIGFQQDLVDAYTYLPKLCSHIHFPIQSGSDRILKLMRRPYKNEKFFALIDAMRKARPDIAITTDVIVGFPDETEEDFLLTVEAFERVKFDNAFIFQYSQRKNTPAAEMEGQISKEEKEQRNQRLLEVVNRIAIEKNDALVGSLQEVLIEGTSKTNAARLQGRTPQNKPVIIEASPDFIGEIVQVRIVESTGFTLYGEIES